MDSPETNAARELLATMRVAQRRLEEIGDEAFLAADRLARLDPDGTQPGLLLSDEERTQIEWRRIERALRDSGEPR